jgi:hypothetical protein
MDFSHDISSLKPGLFYSNGEISYYLHYSSNPNSTLKISNIYNLQKRKDVLIIDNSDSLFFPDYQFSYDGLYLYECDNSSVDTISVWDIDNGMEISKLDVNENKLTFTSSPAPYHGDNYYPYKLIGISKDNSKAVIVWEKYNRAFEVNLIYRSYSIIMANSNGIGYDKAIYYDDEKILLRDNNGTIIIYDLKMKSILRTIKPFFNTKYEILYVSDRLDKIICGLINSIYIWDFSESSKEVYSELFSIRKQLKDKDRKSVV